MSQRLPSYLRTYRKRGALTQDELAFLLGCKRGTKVSRYERLAREPNLETAFACQAIFGVPAHELFPGVLEKVEEKIRERAHVLSRELKKRNPSTMIERKLKLLHAITSEAASEHAINV